MKLALFLVALASVLTAGMESQIQQQQAAIAGQAVQRYKVTETAVSKRTPSRTFTVTPGPRLSPTATPTTAITATYTPGKR